ncbi:hypothetical protein BCT61_13690 [Vibrio breoganii]|uniref:hypothetical protein n=1 Tax=Vibrio breoganii TaxID=553239 RepID=UPI000C85CE0A|nr:hypothetical protein [Vibrio breoganii]PMM07681.1 hypothetical protein BCT61_13690 [Vibrio breoganii]
MNITNHNVEMSTEARALIEEGNMSVYQFNLYILLLKCDVKWLESEGTYQAALKVYLKDQTFIVSISDTSLETAIEKAFYSLQMKLGKHENQLELRVDQLAAYLMPNNRKSMGF